MPAQYRAMVLLAAWCALRFGELTELRRKDLDPSEEVVRVERAVVRTDDGFQVTTPKSEAGVRDVAIPPHLLPAIETHLKRYVTDDADALLFPTTHGGHLAPATLYRRFYLYETHVPHRVSDTRPGSAFCGWAVRMPRSWRDSMR